MDSNFANHEKNIENIKSKRKWKHIASKLNKPDLENEEEEEQIFLENLKVGKEKYNSRLQYRYDEFGTEFTPFHMREEMEEGNIDDSGYFVYKRNRDQDPWYDSLKDELKNKELQKVKQAKTDKPLSVKILDNSKQPSNEDEFNKESKIDVEDKDFALYGEEDLYYKEEKISKDEIQQIEDEIKKYRKKLLDYLYDEETVQQAISRLKLKSQKKLENKNVNKFKPQRKKQKSEETESNLKEKNLHNNICIDSVSKIKEISDLNSEANAEDERMKNEKLFKELLDVISKLTELSHFNVYSDTYSKILSKYGKFDIAQWMYRTIVKLDDDKLEINEYGPFSSEEIKSWLKQDLLKNSENLKFEFKLLKIRGEEFDNWFFIEDPIITELMHSK